MKTEYAGIDYSGHTGVNLDKESGIRYGVISQRSIDTNALEMIFQNGRDLSYENYLGQVKIELRSALKDYFSDHKSADWSSSDLDDAVENAFDAILDGLSDGYESDSSSMLYEQDGYSIQTCLDSDLMVTKSPFFTFAQFCSPCVPGACNLDSPLDIPPGPGRRGWRDNLANQNNCCFCLGHDWFEDGKAPYQVYSVATGEEIQAEVKQ